MNERGQIFTLDMFFALTVTALIVSYSGLVLEQARGQAEGYALRYSLERVANDAADVLVKTAGRPLNWEENIETLETLGLAEENQGNSIQNTLDVGKLSLLRDLCKTNNWDPSRSEVQAVMTLFGGTEDFEIRLIYRDLLARRSLEALDLEIETTWLGVQVKVDAENEGSVIDVEVELRWDEEVEKEAERAPEFVLVVEGGGISIVVVVGEGMIEVWAQTALWDFWPRWDVENSSGANDSLEVVAVERSVAMRPGDVASESGHIGLGKPGVVTDNLVFYIPPGGLEAFDWFIFVETGAGKERREEAKIFVNREIKGVADYTFTSKPDKLEETFPSKHGGVENDLPSPPRTGEIHEGTNYLNIKVTAGGAEAWIKVYVVALPACSSWEITSLARRVLPATLEVKVWK